MDRLQSIPGGLLNPNEREIQLHCRMMTELCRLRGTPSLIDTEGYGKVERMVLIEDNPTSKLLKYVGFNHRAGEDAIVAHVALVDNDPLRDYPPITIKAGWGENKQYRVDGMKIFFDKRFFMTLILYPWSEPRNINTQCDRSAYGSEGRIKANYEEDIEINIGINQPDKSDDPMGEDKVETGLPMITEKENIYNKVADNLENENRVMVITEIVNNPINNIKVITENPEKEILRKEAKKRYKSRFREDGEE